MGLQDYVRVAGLRQLSFTSTGECPIAGGDTAEELEVEMAAARHHHDAEGLVSFVVRGDAPRCGTHADTWRHGRPCGLACRWWVWAGVDVDVRACKRMEGGMDMCRWTD
jgi:hypothetical protein